MNKFGKYMVAALMLVGFNACANDSDELLSSESTEVSRSSDLVTQTIVLTTAGTLQSSLEAVMDEPSTLQKLILSGPFNATDVEYWKTTLTNLVEFDLSAAVPTYSDEVYYKDPWGNDTQLGDNKVGGHMFSFMTKLEKIIFPTVADEILWEACNGCTSLVSADIPASVTFIGNDAFRGCAFTSVVVPETVKNMESFVFADNLQLKSVQFLADMEYIHSGTFYNCPQLTDVVIGSKVNRIHSQGFEGCTSLKDYTPFANISGLYWYAFANTGFENVDLTNVTYIDQALRDCKSLKSVVLPPSMKSTSGYAFWGCDALANITWPTALETISEGTFGGAAFTELTIPPTVTTIGANAFEYSKLEVLTVPATVTKVEGSIINSCSNLRALIWKSTAPVEDVWGVNSNCYLYLDNADVVVGPNWKNIVVNGVAEIVELCPEGYRTDANTGFSVPVPFKAKKITFSRRFDKETVPGTSSGWQTLVLPFTPTKIEHESKGVVAPFNNGVEGAKPFWLRELTAEGFVDKTTIEANKAYIIAMPNHRDYVDEYCLNGKITFSAENVELAATTETLAPSVGPEFSLQPTYSYIERGVSIYALNVDYWVDGYSYGSIFVRNIASVYAFEAYATMAGRSARSAFDINTTSKASRTPYKANKTGIPQIGDM